MYLSPNPNQPTPGCMSVNVFNGNPCHVGCYELTRKKNLRLAKTNFYLWKPTNARTNSKHRDKVTHNDGCMGHQWAENQLLKRRELPGFPGWITTPATLGYSLSVFRVNKKIIIKVRLVRKSSWGPATPQCWVTQELRQHTRPSNTGTHTHTLVQSSPHFQVSVTVLSLLAFSSSFSFETVSVSRCRIPRYPEYLGVD